MAATAATAAIKHNDISRIESASTISRTQTPALKIETPTPPPPEDEPNPIDMSDLKDEDGEESTAVSFGTDTVKIIFKKGAVPKHLSQQVFQNMIN